MMPSIAAAASKSIEIVENLDEEREDIFNKAKYFRQKLKLLDIPFIDSNSHIIPILTYSTKKAKLFSKLLLQQYNSYIQPIFYPTVPEGSARLRITVTPKHSIQDIDNLLAALKRLFDNEKSEQHINTATRQNQVA